jgi:hypothetical protein
MLTMVVDNLMPAEADAVARCVRRSSTPWTSRSLILRSCFYFPDWLPVAVPDWSSWEN